MDLNSLLTIYIFFQIASSTYMIIPGTVFIL